jgi:hypothetical protein
MDRDDAVHGRAVGVDVDDLLGRHHELVEQVATAGAAARWSGIVVRVREHGHEHGRAGDLLGAAGHVVRRAIGARIDEQDVDSGVDRAVGSIGVRRYSPVRELTRGDQRQR